VLLESLSEGSLLCSMCPLNKHNKSLLQSTTNEQRNEFQNERLKFSILAPIHIRSQTKGLKH